MLFMWTPSQIILWQGILLRLDSLLALLGTLSNSDLTHCLPLLGTLPFAACTVTLCITCMHLKYIFFKYHFQDLPTPIALEYTRKIQQLWAFTSLVKQDALLARILPPTVPHAPPRMFTFQLTTAQIHNKTNECTQCSSNCLYQKLVPIKGNQSVFIDLVQLSARWRVELWFTISLVCSLSKQICTVPHDRIQNLKETIW